MGAALDVAWRSETELRLALAPRDDWENPDAHEQGHTVVVARADWSSVGARTIGAEELAAPAEPAVRSDRGARTRRPSARGEAMRMLSPPDAQVGSARRLVAATSTKVTLIRRDQAPILSKETGCHSWSWYG